MTTAVLEYRNMVSERYETRDYLSIARRYVSDATLLFTEIHRHRNRSCGSHTTVVRPSTTLSNAHIACERVLLENRPDYCKFGKILKDIVASEFRDSHSQRLLGNWRTVNWSRSSDRLPQMRAPWRRPLLKFRKSSSDDF